jgi:hypothetical protein
LSRAPAGEAVEHLGLDRARATALTRTFDELQRALGQLEGQTELTNRNIAMKHDVDSWNRRQKRNSFIRIIMNIDSWPGVAGLLSVPRPAATGMAEL